MGYNSIHSILCTLEKILQDEDQIDKFPERVRSDGKIEDFCDGLLFKTHPLFSSDPSALQIIAYYDELELCNPLGTHVKQHKLGMVFFFSLWVISIPSIDPPIERSILSWLYQQ